jgi:hypothetical protein
MAHKVTAALVSIKDPDGKNTYFYEGATVPDGFDKDDVDRLVEAGMLAEIQAEGDPSEAWTVKQLRAHAESAGIDLGDAKSKADILSKISE